MTARRTVFVAVAVLLGGVDADAQSFRRGGTEFTSKRPLSAPDDKPYKVLVTEFLHHGQIRDDGKNVAVYCLRTRAPVPHDVLQLGPGDFCRLAFQTTAGQTAYEVYYGGQPPTEPPPKWTARVGLLLETRKYKDCNLNSADAVREAFDSAEPYGRDYVDAVHHAGNPFSLSAAPFLSRYTGSLHTSAGKYGFLTSSQDCSFLSIDGKAVVSAPGRHGPMYRAKPGSRVDVNLTVGEHKFEYYHAAAGPSAMMVAAWEVSPTDEKPKPTAIPADAFRAGSIGRAEAGFLSMGSAKMMPDFRVEIAGDVPLPDNDEALIGVRLIDASPKALTMRAKVSWDFGDGQTGNQLNADHVYLRPGVYPVAYSLKQGTRTLSITQRINVGRPLLTRKDEPKFHKLDDYLPVLTTYDPRKLDAAALRQLVLAFEAKATALRAPAEEEPPDGPKPSDTTAEDPLPYIEAAVAAGKVAFLEPSAARGAEDLCKLARLVGPMARDELGDSDLAYQIWAAAARKIDVAELRSECALEAADVAVNDLLQGDEAKKLLDAAAAALAGRRDGRLAGRLQQVRGDYYAATGDGKSAREAYAAAEQILSAPGRGGPSAGRRYVERTAWRGAHARSVEEFIRQGQLDRAATRLRRWQREFPTEKIDGYPTLTYARYWAARGKPAQAIAQVEQLQAVAADSPYIDRALVLAADCEVRRGRADRALATLHGLLKDYPGSPLVPEVKKKITQLESPDDM